MIPMNEYPAGTVVPIPFATYGKTNGESITMTGLAVTDIEIYKGTSMTQRASDAGYTLIDTDGIDIDGVTGIHGFSVDLGDDTDAGFFAVGSIYTVVVASITVDGQTVNHIADRFRIVPAEGVTGHPKVDVGGWLGTAPATPTVAGVPEVDVTHWIGTAAATPTVNGVPEVDVTHVKGTAATAAAGIPEVKVASVAAGANNAASYAADTNLYSAVCHLTDKNSATATDRYTVHWFLNGAVVTSGITLPTIQVVKVADGTDLVASVAMSEVGSTGVLKKDVTATLAVRGEAYYADLNATIGGSNRFFRATITRDVSA